MKKSFTTRNIVLAGIFIALAYLMPFLTGQMGELGRRLSPMHFPILLAGFFCHPAAALIAGAVAPLLRSVTLGMPPIFPTAVSMSLELAVYGLAASMLYHYLPKKRVNIYTSLIGAMLLGRIVGGVANLILLGINGKGYTFGLFMTGMFIDAIPGIILQIAIIPIIVIALEKAKIGAHK